MFFQINPFYYVEGLDFAVPVFSFGFVSHCAEKIRPLQLQRLAVSVPDGARRCPPRERFGFIEPHTAKTKRQALPVLLFWRRRRDLNPRASCPTYTLSRGASSPLEYFSKVKMFLKYSFSGRIVTKLSALSKVWRREWDSNPRGLAPKRFSRPPRYDRFDISPN